jgi:hypothetical protein
MILCQRVGLLFYTGYALGHIKMMGTVRQRVFTWQQSLVRSSLVEERQNRREGLDACRRVRTEANLEVGNSQRCIGAEQGC